MCRYWCNAWRWRVGSVGPFGLCPTMPTQRIRCWAVWAMPNHADATQCSCEPDATRRDASGARRRGLWVIGLNGHVGKIRQTLNAIIHMLYYNTLYLNNIQHPNPNDPKPAPFLGAPPLSAAPRQNPNARPKSNPYRPTRRLRMDGYPSVDRVYRKKSDRAAIKGVASQIGQRYIGFQWSTNRS